MNPEITNELRALTRDLVTAMAHGDAMLARINRKPDLVGVRPWQAKQMEIIVAVVCKKFGVPMWMIYSRDRHEAIARARQVCMVIGRDRLQLSSKQVGKMFQRDHGTVLSAEKAIRNLIQTNIPFQRDFDDAVKRIELELQPSTPAAP